MDQEITEVFETVAEITSDPGGMVTVSPDVLASVIEGDDDPRFATFVIESGWSKSKRYWGGELFGEVVAEIQKSASSDPIVGYMGHIKEEDDPYVFPEIQLQWVGAKMLQVGDKAKMAVKAYVLPGTKGRDYLRRGLVKTVSWRGKAAQVPYEKGVRVRQFHIESIDLSRPRSAGMSARLVGALTSEMEGGRQVDAKEIAALTTNDLRAHAPELVESIEKDARSPLETKVSEMETEVTESKKVIDFLPKLREILGLDDNADGVAIVESAFTKLRAEARTLRESILDEVLKKRFKGGSDADKALVRRVLVGEMKDRDVKLTGNKEKDETAISEFVTEMVDGDESLKETVSEMEKAPPNVPGTTDDGNSTKEWKPGMETSNVRVKARV